MCHESELFDKSNAVAIKAMAMLSLAGSTTRIKTISDKTMEFHFQ